MKKGYNKNNPKAGKINLKQKNQANKYKYILIVLVLIKKLLEKMKANKNNTWMGNKMKVLPF